MPSIAELMLAELDREAVGTRKALERVPEGMDDWMPHEKSMPLGYLATLVASMIDAIRDSAINHLAHHRGQLTVYLRLTDRPVPAIYGPSADERSFQIPAET